jgi:hypothetical protein
MAKKTETKTKGAAKATNKTTAGTKPVAKKAPKAKAEAKAAAPRHPKARVVAGHKTKADLAKTVAAGLVREDEDPANLATTLATASNAQLLRLHDVVETVKTKFGSRAKLIAAIGTAEKKSKDKDYLTKLDSMPLPALLALANEASKRASASST